MAGTEGKKYNIKQPAKTFLRRKPAAKKYFFVDGKLYKSIRSNRTKDILRAWCFNDKKLVDFVWSDVKRRMQQAYDTVEVAYFLNRTRETIFRRLWEGQINRPIQIYNEGKKIGTYKWSEDDVLALHDYYSSIAIGRPRKDGTIRNPQRLPTRLELIALMKQNKMVYVQDEDGEYIPIFDEADWS